MCQAYCQASQQGRGHVYCGNSHQAEVCGMTGRCEQSGRYDTGNKNGRSELVEWNEMVTHRCQKPSTRPCYWLREAQSPGDQDAGRWPSTQQTFLTTQTSWRDVRVRGNQTEPPGAVPNPKASEERKNHSEKPYYKRWPL